MRYIMILIFSIFILLEPCCAQYAEGYYRWKIDRYGNILGTEYVEYPVRWIAESGGMHQGKVFYDVYLFGPWKAGPAIFSRDGTKLADIRHRSGGRVAIGRHININNCYIQDLEGNAQYHGQRLSPVDRLIKDKIKLRR